MTIIYTIVGIIILGSIAIMLVLFIGGKRNPRQEPLTVMIDGDTVRFFLTDSDYDMLDISSIKDDKDKVYEEIKNLVQGRSQELVKFVNRVTFFKDGDPKKEKELYEIISSKI